MKLPRSRQKREMDQKAPPTFQRQQEKQLSDIDNLQDADNLLDEPEDEGLDGAAASASRGSSSIRARGGRHHAQAFNFEESDQQMGSEEQEGGTRGEPRQAEAMDLEVREGNLQRQGRMSPNMINDIMNLI